MDVSQLDLLSQIWYCMANSAGEQLWNVTKAENQLVLVVIQRAEKQTDYILGIKSLLLRNTALQHFLTIEL